MTTPAETRSFCSPWIRSACLIFFAIFAKTVLFAAENEFDASVVNIMMPPEIAVGEAFSINVLMRNTGRVSWTGSTDAAPWFAEHRRSDTIIFSQQESIELSSYWVPPGKTAAFTIDCVAPKAPGSYAIAWQMRNATNGWFGQVARTNISVAATWRSKTSANRISHYTSRIWQHEDGLPQNAVQAVVQTEDGYLWAATQQGLARFNGMEFVVFNERSSPTLKNPFTYVLEPAKDGGLWIGTFNAGLARFHHGSFSFFSTTDGLAANAIRAICEMRDGTVWIGTTNGLSCYRENRFQTLIKAEEVGQVVRALTEDADGNLWAGTSMGVKQIRENKVLRSLSMDDGLPAQDVRSLHWDQRGQLWIGLSVGVAVWDGKKVRAFTRNEGLPDNLVNVVYADHRNNIWVGTSSGLCRFVGGSWIKENDNSDIAFNAVTAICEDREGNIWVGTKDGLHRLTLRPFSTYTQQHGLSHNNVMSVTETRDGSIWATTWGGGLNRFKNGRFTVYDHSHGLLSDTMMALCEGHTGDLWVGLDFFEAGLIRFQPGEKIFHYGTQSGLVDLSVRVIHEDRRGDLWIGTRSALCRLRDEKISRYATAEGLAGQTIRAIFEDNESRIWIGTSGGINIWNGKELIALHAPDGLLKCPVVSFYQDADNVLWVGTLGQGLFRFPVSSLKFQVSESPSNLEFRTSNFRCYTTKQGLFSDDIHEILEDNHRRLWMSCRNGVFYVTRQNLDDLDAGKTSVIGNVAYGKNEGLLSGECNIVAKPSAWRSRDGRLWFATVKGLAVIDPNGDLGRNEKVPPVMIEEVISDKQPFKVSSLKFEVPASDGPATSNLKLQTLNLKPGRGEMEIHFAALSFQAPEKNRFKYKLEGVDSDWVDAGTRRFAYYNNLRPGNYRFHVIACNNDGAWNEEGAEVRLILQPHFWQTSWFLALMALAAVGLVGGTARYLTAQKLRRNLEQLEQQHAIEKERARIARDMHDDLGVRLTELLLIGDRASREETGLQETKSLVRKTLLSIREVVDGLDAIVWAVNPKNDSLHRFVPYVREYVQSFLEPTSIRFTLDIASELPDWPLSSETRHNLFMVVRETLNNVVKHAGASEVAFRLKLDGVTLVISIEDNGKGFSTEAASSFGNGLLNMRKRIESIGGCFELQSEPGKGTRICLQIPLKPGV